MATINLGAIKFNWKGAYNSGTAYAVDDVVSSGGSSYVCILASTGNATSNGTYWEQMSSAGTNGTNGTDLSTTLTTQGDLLYRDGSGLQRLAKGTAGQVLKINSGATAPEWGTDAGGRIGAFSNVLYSGGLITNTANNNAVVTGSQISLTPSATSSKIFYQATLQGCRKAGATYMEVSLQRKITSGGSYSTIDKFVHGHLYTATSITQTGCLALNFVDTPNTTSEVFYQLIFRNVANAGTVTIHTDSQEATQYTLMEIKA